MLKPTHFLALLLFAATHAFADAPAQKPSLDAAAIDQVITKAMEEQHIPGVALGIVHNGELRYAKGYGKANVEKNVPVTPDTVFAIASVSKPILALGVARLAEQGKLSLDDPIAMHLPGTPDAWKDMRLTHLMNHTSGIVRESPAFQGDKIKPDFDLVKSTYGEPLVFPTGSGMQYCNICYFALADVMARVSGETWPAYMAREIFQRAGMKDTKTTAEREKVANRALSYERKLLGQTAVTEYLALRPSGAFISTVNDLARFEAAMRDGRFVSPTMMKCIEAQTTLANGKVGKMRPESLSYGLGWEVSELGGRRRLAHSGALAGFRTMYARYPDQGWAVILLTNGAQAKTTAIENAVAELVVR